ncbi:MAG: hypothetical protein UHD07_02295 [Ruminobacter sp.]|nr:hypothetical protein [Ruminobacter sp.]
MKSYKSITSLLAITFAFLFTACSSYVAPTPVTGLVPQGLTKEQVRRDIGDACQSRDMTYKDISDNEIEAIYARGNMFIAFTIRYDASQYTIIYKDSENLKSKKGKIHSKYLKWVNNLNKSIHNELANTKFDRK